MPDTPSTKYGIARPADADFINTWPATMRTAIDLIDSLMATAITTMPRPAAGKFGRIHRATDGTISFDTGTTWEEIARASSIAQIPLGVVVSTASSVLPSDGRWAWADGALIDKTVYAQYFTEVGHSYNGGVDPGGNMVKKPDARGRVRVGADNMGIGAAGRLPNTNRARGQNHGEERHPLTIPELAVHAHTASQSAHGHAGTATSLGSTLDHLHGAYGGGYLYYLVGGPGAVLTDSSFGGPVTVTGSADRNLDHVHPLTTDSQAPGVSVQNNGSGTPHNVMQPGEVDNYIVRIA
jgi:microcystin-dependent protein